LETGRTVSLKVLTFNLHSQYLYLLSFTGWDIDNLVIPPTDPPDWHTQPYGYPTHSPAVHPVPGFDYHAYFPVGEWTNPPMVPLVDNIRNVLSPEEDYDLIVYLERDSLRFYQGPARKKVMVNFNADGFSPNGYVDNVVSHVRDIPETSFIPMGIPDNYLPRNPNIEGVLVSYAAGRWRPHLINQEMLESVSKVFPLHLHDMVEELWDYRELAQVLSRFWVYFSPVKMTGGPPLACIEAFMAGMPVILYDPHNHFSGFTNKDCSRVKSSVEASSAAMVLRSSESQRQEIGEAGRERAKKFFNINRFVEGWWQVAA